ncbi:hypothetical protein HX805_25585 [Pseudomonas sp. G5001]|uniref:hypothetical protein n=1 Tax=Pseudomonas sp. G5001 TaxID=2738824 RepID=UPI0015A0B593|nr:hypothetical protein [Pseudomonas sp. G5001]NWB75847.1 hypothetical protein [Pseudomonas sp. G5001]
MTSSVLKDGFPAAYRTTRERIEGSIDLGRLFAAIDAHSAIAGAGVGATMSVIGSGVSGNIRTLAIGLYEEFE